MIFKQTGFTIVELMIAITVFAVASTLVLSGVIYIGRQYQGSSNRVKIEDASRNIHQQISQSIQFSNKPEPVKTFPDGTSKFKVFCTGTDKYIFSSTNIVNEATYNSAQAGLYLTLNDDNCGSARNNQTNLLPEGAKVAYFNYDTANSQLTTIIILAPSDGGDLVKTITAPATAADAGCDYTKPGREFCSSVKFESSSIGRLTN